jgi:hypothetical protein
MNLGQWMTQALARIENPECKTIQTLSLQKPAARKDNKGK